MRRWTATLAGIAAGLAIMATVTLQGRPQPDNTAQQHRPVLTTPTAPAASSTHPPEIRFNKAAPAGSYYSYFADPSTGITIGIQRQLKDQHVRATIRVIGIPAGTKYKVGLNYISQSQPIEYGDTVTSQSHQATATATWTVDNGIDNRALKTAIHNAPAAAEFTISPAYPPRALVITQVAPRQQVLYERDMTLTDWNSPENEDLQVLGYPPQLLGVPEGKQGTVGGSSQMRV